MENEFQELCDLCEEQGLLVELFTVTKGLKKGATPTKFRVVVKKTGSVVLDLAQTKVEDVNKLGRNAIQELKGRGLLHGHGDL